MLEGIEYYLSSDSSNSLYYDNENLKRALWEAFEGYQQRLDDEKLCNLSFFVFRPDNPCCKKVVLLDECFDLNRYQLRSLMNICSRLVIKGDLNQALGDTSNLMGFAESEMKRRKGDKFTLIGTHRSRKNIAEVGTSILDYKQKLKLRRPSGVLKVESLLPYFGWVRFDRELTYRPDWYVGLSTAVICHESEIQRVKEICNTPLIFTVEQIKGLGYPRVVILNLLSSSSDESRLMAKTFLSLLEKKGVSRGSIQSEDHAVLATTHALYTAIMRSEVELVFINEAPGRSYSQMIPFVDRMKSVIAQPHPDEPGVKRRTAIIDYLRERRRLRESENTIQASEVDAKIKEKLSLQIKVEDKLYDLCISSPENNHLKILRKSPIAIIKDQFKLKHFLGFLWANVSDAHMDPVLVIDVFLKLRGFFSADRFSFKVNDVLHDVSNVSLAGMLFRPGNSRKLMSKRIPLFRLSADDRGCQTLCHWLSAYEHGVRFNFSNFMEKSELIKPREQGVMRGSTFFHGLVQHGQDFLMRCLNIFNKSPMSHDSSTDSGAEKDPLCVVSDWFSDLFDVESLLIKSLSTKSFGKTPWHYLLSTDEGCQFIFFFMERSPDVFEKSMLAILSEALKFKNVDVTVLALESMCKSHHGKLVLEKWFNDGCRSSGMLLNLSMQAILADNSRTSLLTSIYPYSGVVSMFFDWLDANQDSPEKLKPLLRALLVDPGFFLLSANNHKSLKYFYIIHEDCNCKERLYSRMGDLFKSEGNSHCLRIGFLSNKLGQLILTAWAKASPGVFSNYVGSHFLAEKFDSGRPCLLELHKTIEGRKLISAWRSACTDFNNEALRLVSRDSGLVKCLLYSEGGLKTLSECFNGEGVNIGDYFSSLSSVIVECRAAILKLVDLSIYFIFPIFNRLIKDNEAPYRSVIDFFKAIEPDYPLSGELSDNDPIVCILLLLGTSVDSIREQVQGLMAPLINNIDNPVRASLSTKKVISFLASQLFNPISSLSMYAGKQLVGLEGSESSESYDSSTAFIVHFLSRQSKYNYFSEEVFLALSRHEVMQKYLSWNLELGSTTDWGLLGGELLGGELLGGELLGDSLMMSGSLITKPLLIFIKKRLSFLSSDLMSKSALPVSRRVFSDRALDVLKAVCDQIIFIGVSFTRGSYFFSHPCMIDFLVLPSFRVGSILSR